MAEDAKKTKIKSKEYPAVTLNQSIEFINKLKEYPMNKPISYDVAANTIGVSPTTKSFTYTISAAKQFGLISTSSGTALSFLEPAKKLAYPTGNSSEIISLKIQCFRNPKLYSELIKEYEGRALPPLNILQNLLVSNYGIAPNVKEIAAKTFIDSANEAGTIQSGILCLDGLQSEENSSTPNGLEEKNNILKEDMSEQIPENVIGMEKLVVPFGQQRQATVYIPSDITVEDAEYFHSMIFQMLKRVYKLESK